MNRIFTPLAATAILLMSIAMALGLWLRAGDIRDPHDRVAQQWATTHRLAGVGVGLVVVLVNSIVATYFIGTSRWCKEVVETYSLDREFIRRSARLKRRTFPYALMNMLLIVGVIALGGAADPGGAVQANARIAAQAPRGMTWANWHFAGATLGICCIAYAFFAQWHHIGENHQVIEDVMAEVKRVRTERGLEG